MLDRDKLINVDHAEIARATMHIIDTTQIMRPEVKTPAIAAAFLLLVERLDLSVGELFGITTNIMHFADGRRPEFKAVSAYLENEL